MNPASEEAPHSGDGWPSHHSARSLFLETLQKTIHRANGKGQGVGVLFVSFEDFRRIHHTLGSSLAGGLLYVISQRLREILSREATLASIGKGDFVALLPSITTPASAVSAAKKILKAFREPLRTRDHEFIMALSIGISLYPDDDDAETLLRNAATAMYRGREERRGYYKMYSTLMTVKAHEKFALERDLRRALERHEFQLYYQPLVNVQTGRIEAMEALLRWMHPTMGMIAPLEFLPVAEETGFIVPLGEWVLREACEQMRRWKEAGHQALRVCVNISGRQLLQKDFGQIVEKILQETGIEPRELELELIENIIVERIEELIPILRDLKRRGLRFSLDDFGTGYSSFSSIRHFPIRTIKIDRSFVRDVVTNSDDRAIVKAVISMAHSLKLNVVAEGVETETQWEFLKSQQCDEVQGFLCSRPLPATACEEYLLDRRLRGRRKGDHER